MNFLSMFKGIGGGWEMGRSLWASGAVSIIGFQGYDLFNGHHFDAMNFGGGFAALMVAAGFGIAAKDKGVAAAGATTTTTKTETRP